MLFFININGCTRKVHIRFYDYDKRILFDEYYNIPIALRIDDMTEEQKSRFFKTRKEALKRGTLVYKDYQKKEGKMKEFYTLNQQEQDEKNMHDAEYVHTVMQELAEKEAEYLHFKKTNPYGSERLYPNCPKSELFCKLLCKKTISRLEVGVILKLGFSVKIRSVESDETLTPENSAG